MTFRSSEITPRGVYVGRRAFIQAAATALATAAPPLARVAAAFGAPMPAPHGRRFENVQKSPLSTTEPPNPWEHITTYNNFYEYGIDKDAPSKNAHRLQTDPWSVVVDGECARKGTYPLDDILKGQSLEERIYRHRCVEGWSMVIPWVGFPLANFIKRCEPTGNAKFVEFTTLADPAQMTNIRSSVLRWPYVEGLRMDEALHPLTILAVGLYGEVMPKQDGAPIRLVVPWKYGFKSAKSIVKIRFVAKQPETSWELKVPEYYAFYSNVNPGRTYSEFRDQSTERRLGEFRMRKTQLFNGYGDQVASLYSGMDLRTHF